MAIPTPEQARELVDHFGTQSAACEAIGVACSTFRYWLNPEPRRAYRRREYAADPEKQRRTYAAYYHGLSGVAYSRRLLRLRRAKALRRRAEREQRRP